MLRNRPFRQKLEMMEKSAITVKALRLYILILCQRICNLPDSFHRIILRVRVLLMTPHPGVYEGESDNGQGDGSTNSPEVTLGLVRIGYTLQVHSKV